MVRSIELIELIGDVLSRILIPYIYTIRVLLARKIFHEENFLQAKFFLVTLMYRFRYYSIDYIAVIPTHITLSQIPLYFSTLLTFCGNSNGLWLAASLFGDAHHSMRPPGPWPLMYSN